MFKHIAPGAHSNHSSNLRREASESTQVKVSSVNQKIVSCQTSSLMLLIPHSGIGGQQEVSVYYVSITQALGFPYSIPSCKDMLTICFYMPKKDMGASHFYESD